MPPSRQRTLNAESLRGFTGVNLRKDTLSLADAELARAINVEMHTMPGVLQARLGSTLLLGEPIGAGGGRVRRLTRYGTRRYQVKGGNLFRDGTAIYTALSPNNVTSFLHYRPLTDATTWTFIADDNVMQKDDGETLCAWGPAAPQTEPTLVATSGGRLTAGEYTVVYTYARRNDGGLAHETNPSPTSRTITLAGEYNAIWVTDFALPTDTQFTHLRFYRTLEDGTDHFFEVQIDADASVIEYGLTQTWEDDEESTIEDLGTVFTQFSQRDGTRVCFDWEVDHNAGKDAHLHRAHSGMVSSTPVRTSGGVLLRDPDSGIGVAVETDNDPPPVCSWVTAFQEHAFLCRDALNPNYLWWSKRYRPECVPSDNYIDIGTSEDPLQCAVPLVGFLGVFSLLTKYRVLGNDTSGFVHIEALSSRGTPAPNAVTITEAGALYVARDGLFLTDFLAKDELLSQAIEPLFYGETLHDYAPIDWAYAGELCTASWKQRLYFGYRDTAGERNLAVYSRATGQWFFYGFNAVSLFVEEADDQLTMGTANAEAVIIEVPGLRDDRGDDITLEVWLPERAFGDAFRYKLFHYVQVDAECHQGAVTGELWLDGVLRHTFSVTGSRTRQLLRLPDKLLGKVWQLRFSYSGQERIAIYAADVLALPLNRA
jgi:hypothetical protein